MSAEVSDSDLVAATETPILYNAREVLQTELDWCAQFSHRTVAMFWKLRLNLALINAELARRSSA